VLSYEHLGRLMGQYQEYFNEARPHQGIGQRIPGKPILVVDPSKPIVLKPVLGGLHHELRLWLRSTPANPYFSVD
jgi:putative transposase